MPRHFLEIGQRCLRNRFGGAEGMQQRAFTRRTYAGNFFERAFGELLLATRPVGSDGEAVRLVAQSLHEIKRRVARRQPERRDRQKKKYSARRARRR